MALQEVLTKIKYSDFGKKFEIPVKFCEELQDENDFQTLINKNSFYIFVLCTIQGEVKKHFYGDAQRHKDFQSAVEQVLGKVDSYIWGQLFCEEKRLTNLRLAYGVPPYLTDTNDIDLIKPFLTGINRDFLRANGVRIKLGGNRDYRAYKYLPLLNRYTRVDPNQI